MKVGNITGIGFSGINDDNVKYRVIFLCAMYALEKDRVAPSTIGTDEYNQFGMVYVIIAVRYGITAKGAFMSCDG